MRASATRTVGRRRNDDDARCRALQDSWVCGRDGDDADADEPAAAGDGGAGAAWVSAAARLRRFVAADFSYVGAPWVSHCGGAGCGMGHHGGDVELMLAQVGLARAVSSSFVRPRSLCRHCDRGQPGVTTWCTLALLVLQWRKKYARGLPDAALRGCGGVGNGGFSLRDVAAMRDVTRRYGVADETNGLQASRRPRVVCVGF